MHTPEQKCQVPLTPDMPGQFLPQRFNHGSEASGGLSIYLSIFGRGAWIGF